MSAATSGNGGKADVVRSPADVAFSPGTDILPHSGAPDLAGTMSRS